MNEICEIKFTMLSSGKKFMKVILKGNLEEINNNSINF